MEAHVSPGRSGKAAHRYFVPQTNLSHKIVEERSSSRARCRSVRTEEAALLESKKYRQYAAECVRMAHMMAAGDKQVLLEIAAAWETRAEEAERREKVGRSR